MTEPIDAWVGLKPNTLYLMFRTRATTKYEPISKYNTIVSVYVSGITDPWVGRKARMNDIPHSSSSPRVRFSKFDMRRVDYNFSLLEIMRSGEDTITTINHHFKHKFIPEGKEYRDWTISKICWAVLRALHGSSHHDHHSGYNPDLVILPAYGPLIVQTIQEVQTQRPRRRHPLPIGLTILRVEPERERGMNIIYRVEYDYAYMPELLPALKPIGEVSRHHHVHRHRGHRDHRHHTHDDRGVYPFKNRYDSRRRRATPMKRSNPSDMVYRTRRRRVAPQITTMHPTHAGVAVQEPLVENARLPPVVVAEPARPVVTGPALVDQSIVAEPPSIAPVAREVTYVNPQEEVYTKRRRYSVSDLPPVQSQHHSHHKHHHRRLSQVYPEEQESSRPHLRRLKDFLAGS